MGLPIWRGPVSPSAAAAKNYSTRTCPSDPTAAGRSSIRRRASVHNRRNRASLRPPTFERSDAIGIAPEPTPGDGALPRPAIARPDTVGTARAPTHGEVLPVSTLLGLPAERRQIEENRAAESSREAITLVRADIREHYNMVDTQLRAAGYTRDRGTTPPELRSSRVRRENEARVAARRSEQRDRVREQYETTDVGRDPRPGSQLPTPPVDPDEDEESSEDEANVWDVMRSTIAPDIRLPSDSSTSTSFAASNSFNQSDSRNQGSTSTAATSFDDDAVPSSLQCPEDSMEEALMSPASNTSDEEWPAQAEYFMTESSDEDAEGYTRPSRYTRLAEENVQERISRRRYMAQARQDREQARIESGQNHNAPSQPHPASTGDEESTAPPQPPAEPSAPSSVVPRPRAHIADTRSREAIEAAASSDVPEEMHIMLNRLSQQTDIPDIWWRSVGLTRIAPSHPPAPAGAPSAPIETNNNNNSSSSTDASQGTDIRPATPLSAQEHRRQMRQLRREGLVLRREGRRLQRAADRNERRRLLLSPSPEPERETR
ncbi:hypothetical protein LTR66_001450 [Elasticomyces elasticus]|nr:hypothetical protein LTR66_001450 [Elasticomyces elasticus]